MRKVFSKAFLAAGFLVLCASFASATTQTTSSVSPIAVDPGSWSSNFTRAPFDVPASSPARPAASRFDDDTLDENAVTAPDIAIAPGRLDMPNSKLISMNADGVPPMMIVNPTRPMALESPLAIPEPASLLLCASGLMGLAFLRRQRMA
jgi:hypothetical protein